MIPLKVTVRSTQMKRLLNNLTHPSDDGASRMVFPKKEPSITPEILLLLGIMNDEFESRLDMPALKMEEHLERPPTPSVKRVSQLVNFQELPVDYIPPAPQRVVCEFLLTFGPRNFTHGKVMLAVFHQLVFHVEGNVRMNVKGAYDGQKVGRDPEASGIWRAANRCKRPTKAPGVKHHNESRQTG